MDEQLDESTPVGWHSECGRACQLLSRRHTERLSPDQETLVYQFVAALLMEGLQTSLERFEFEDKFDCWNCAGTGLLSGKNCSDCGGQGYRGLHWASGMRLEFCFDGILFECQLGSGLLQNYSKKHEIWERFNQLPAQWHKATFEFVPMRVKNPRISSSQSSVWKTVQRWFVATPPLPDDVPRDAFDLVARIVAQKRTEIRKLASSKAAATRKRKA